MAANYPSTAASETDPIAGPALDIEEAARAAADVAIDARLDALEAGGGETDPVASAALAAHEALVRADNVHGLDTQLDAVDAALALKANSADVATDAELAAAVATINAALANKQDSATAATDAELAAAVATLNTAINLKQDASTAATDAELATHAGLTRADNVHGLDTQLDAVDAAIALKQDASTAATDAELSAAVAAHAALTRTDNVHGLDTQLDAIDASIAAIDELLTRTTKTKVTGSLADNAAETGLWDLGNKSVRAIRIVTDVAARVQIYTLQADRDADIARPVGSDPTGDHGVLFDFVTTPTELDWRLSPAVDMSDGTPDINFPYRITNLSGSTDTVQVDLTVIPTEAA